MRNNPNDFQSIPNPYIVGKPIEDKHMFFGRMDDFAFISKKVSGAEKGGIIVLCGSRRSGKTSILFQIRQGRLGEGFVPVLIDMQAMTVQSDKEFLSKLAVEVASAVGSHEISFEKDFYEKSSENPYGAFQEFAGKVDSALKGKKLIIMFDEYELFETHIEKGKFSADILNTLANWMEHKRGK
jgi:AAA+ ATPase superfamily predicted ATPase